MRKTGFLGLTYAANDDLQRQTSRLVGRDAVEIAHWEGPRCVGALQRPVYQPDDQEGVRKIQPKYFERIQDAHRDV